jgi:hypothetical protein
MDERDFDCHLYFQRESAMILFLAPPSPSPPDAVVKHVMSYAFRVQFLSNKFMHI